jgi:predicted RNase H-like HicB family nuclease
MKRYGCSVTWHEADEAYVATCPEFPGVSAFGPTPESAVAEMEVALELAMETYLEEGWELPEPVTQPRHSGQFRVRLPRGLHARLATRAAQEGVSLNTLVVTYLAEAVGPYEPRSRAADASPQG